MAYMLEYHKILLMASGLLAGVFVYFWYAFYMRVFGDDNEADDAQVAAAKRRKSIERERADEQETERRGANLTGTELRSRHTKAAGAAGVGAAQRAAAAAAAESDDEAEVWQPRSKKGD